MVDIVSNKIIGEVPLEDVTYERSLKQPGSFEGKITVSDQTTALDLYNATLPGKTALYVVRNSEAVWGGIIWGRTYDLVGRSLAISASEFTSYLGKRIVWKTYTNSYTVQLGKSANGGTPYFYVRLTNGTFRQPLSVTDGFGNPTKVEITFRDTKLRKYTGFYDIAGSSSSPAAFGNPNTKGFFVNIPKLPVPPTGIYQNVSLSTKSDTYSYLRDLINSTFNDFIDLDFPNDTIEPGIREAYEVKYMQLTTTNSTNGTAKITTEQPHGLVVGQRVEMANLDPMIDGVFEISSVPTTTTFEYILKDPVSQEDNQSPIALKNIPANTVPFTERTPVFYRKISQQLTEYVTTLKRVSGLTTLKTTSVHPFTVGEKVIVNIAAAKPAMRTIDGKSVNIFDYKKVNDTVQISATTDYTISFVDPLYTTSKHDVKETSVLKPGANTVKNAADRPFLILTTKKGTSDGMSGVGRGHNIGNKVRVAGVDSYNWSYPIYDGFHQLYDVSGGTSNTVTHYTVAEETLDTGDIVRYVALEFTGNVGYNPGDYLLVDGFTDDSHLDGEYQIYYANYNSGTNKTTVKYYKLAELVSRTTAPSGTTATLNGTAWVAYPPANSEIRYSLKDEPDSKISIASLRFTAAKGTAKNKVTVTTQSRHQLSVGDTVVVDFGNAEKGKDTKTYGGRVTVSSVTDLDEFSYILSGQREIAIPTVDLVETAKTGVVSRRITYVGSKAAEEVQIDAISAELDSTGGAVLTAYATDHDLVVGDTVVIDINDSKYYAFENKNAPTRVESVTQNSFTYNAEIPNSLVTQVQANVSAITCTTVASKPYMDILIDGVVTETSYPEQQAKILNVNLTMADKGRVVYTYAKVAEATLSSGGATGQTTLVLTASNAAIKPGLLVRATGLAADTVVSAVNGATITIDTPATSQVSGTITFDIRPNWDYEISISGFATPTPQIVPAATGSAQLAAFYTRTVAFAEAVFIFQTKHNLIVPGKVYPWGTSPIGDITGSVTISGLQDTTVTQYWLRTYSPVRRIPDVPISLEDYLSGDYDPRSTVYSTVSALQQLSKLNGTYMIARVLDEYSVSLIYDGPNFIADISGGTASWTGLPQTIYPEGAVDWGFLNMVGNVERAYSSDRTLHVLYPLLPGNADDLIALGGATNDFTSQNIIMTLKAYKKKTLEFPEIVVGDYIDLVGFLGDGYTSLNKSGPHKVIDVFLTDNNGVETSSNLATKRKIRIANPLPLVKGVKQTVKWPPVGGSTDTPKLVMPSRASGTAYIDYSTVNSSVMRVVGVSRLSASPTTAVVTTANNHNFETGDYVNISVYGKGLSAFTQKNSPNKITKISETQFSYPMVSPTKIQYYSVNRNVATLSFYNDNPHCFFIGDTVSISGVASAINGTRIITSTGPGTISFTVSTANVAKKQVKGTLSLTTPVTVTNAVDNVEVSSIGQASPAPTIYREPVVFSRTWGEFPKNSGIGGLTFSTNEYSGELSSNSPLYGSALASVADILDKYSNSLTGFEYRIDVSLESNQNGEKEFKRKFVLIPLYPDSLTDYLNSLPDKKLAKGQVADPTAFGADKVIFEYPGNITNVSVAENATSSATRIFVNNKNNKAGEGTEAAYAAAAATELLAEGWPILDKAESVDWPMAVGAANSTNIDKWGNHDDEHDYHTSAKRFLRENRPPAGDIVITVNGSITPVVGSYNPGEWCSIIVNDQFLKNRLGTSLEPRKDVFIRRIDAIQVQVPNNPAFPEQINLTLVPDWQVDKVGE
jgi:hypothetical protein